jgi:hypothetical protein
VNHRSWKELPRNPSMRLTLKYQIAIEQVDVKIFDEEVKLRVSDRVEFNSFNGLKGLIVTPPIHWKS